MKELFRPLVHFYVRLRFRDIWKLKTYLHNSHQTSGIYASYYFQYFSKKGSYIGIDAQLGNDIYFPHGVVGIFISNDAVIGDGTVIFQQVTIGSDLLVDSKKFGSPIVGKQVYIGAGAKIIGAITVGDRTRIGANAVVYQDLPADSVAVCSPTRIIQKDHLDNRFLRIRNGRKEYYQDGSFHELEE